MEVRKRRRIQRRRFFWAMSRTSQYGAALKSLPEIIFLQELRSKLLGRIRPFRPTFGRKVHHVPVGPDGVDMVTLELRAPEVMNLAIDFAKHVHDWPLHVVGFALESRNSAWASPEHLPRPYKTILQISWGFMINGDHHCHGQPLIRIRRKRHQSRRHWPYSGKAH